MAYDAARGVTVLYGGQKYYEYGRSLSEPDTWEWDGQSWTKVATASGEALCLLGMAYDVDRQKVIRHGGMADVWDGRVSSTWEYDGQTWTQIADGLMRGAQGMVYDTVRGKMLLFGGVIHSPANSPTDTWEFDGAQWQQVATNGPPGRRDAQEMIFDSHRGVAVLFGGDFWDEQTPVAPPHFIVYGDTWEWDGVQWRQLNLSGPGPAPRYGHAMAYDSKRRKVVLFGGTLYSHAGPRANDTWEYGLPPLQLTGLERRPDGSLNIQWTGEAPPYQLQSRTNLNTGDWQDEGAPTDQTSATVQLEGTMKFFRVLSTVGQTQ